MNAYRADLHIHTCLSPCGSLEMSPDVIVQTALGKGLDAIAITDHNSMKQCREIIKLGAEKGLTVFCGVEVTTKEEAHCLAFFETEVQQNDFQSYMESYLPPIQNNPEKFGDQVWVNSRNEIMGEEPYLLISALNQSIDQIALMVKRLSGLFVAAHVERPSYSVISQLGFIDSALNLDAIEYNQPERFETLKSKQKYLSAYTAYTASDAHYPEQIGTRPSLFYMEELSFDELRQAMRWQNGRYIHTINN